jgi:alpha-tubulin suppressor-like RCC1 family protein
MIRSARAAGLMGALMLAAAPACYRPHVIDCVVACDPRGGCPDGLSCADGLCTRGATCVTAVAAGGKHSCAVRGTDAVCWGSNTYGQLGVPGAGDRGDGADSLPARVPLDPGGTPVALAAGGRHTCAIIQTGATSPVAGAMNAASHLACWGDNSFGQLGDPTPARGTPSNAAPFTDFPAALSPVQAVTAGLYHTCAIVGAGVSDGTGGGGGAVVCWGDNRFGQLGVPRDAAHGPFTPVPLAGPAVAVAAGAYHTCAILQGGDVACWGWDDYGQLGDANSPAGDSAPGTIVTVTPGAGRARALAAGAYHTCAIDDDARVVCWGQGRAGQVGVPYQQGSPRMAPTTAIDLGRSARALAVGSMHTCALLDDFTVRCWGFNADGELGLGDTANRGADVAVTRDLAATGLDGGDPVAQLAAGASHTCAIQGARVRCWGLGESGRLGGGDTKSRGDDVAHPITQVLFGL